MVAVDVAAETGNVEVSESQAASSGRGKAENQKVSTARLEREGGEKSGLKGSLGHRVQC